MPAKAGIQYAAAPAIEPLTLWNTGSPPTGERSDAVLRTAMAGTTVLVNHRARPGLRGSCHRARMRRPDSPQSPRGEGHAISCETGSPCAGTHRPCDVRSGRCAVRGNPSRVELHGAHDPGFPGRH